MTNCVPTIIQELVTKHLLISLNLNIDHTLCVIYYFGKFQQNPSIRFRAMKNMQNGVSELSHTVCSRLKQTKLLEYACKLSAEQGIQSQSYCSV